MSRHAAISQIWRLNLLALWVLLATVAFFGGLMVRDWTWQQTAPIRFHGDIRNALSVGRETVMAATHFEQGRRPELPDNAAVWRSYLNRYDAEYARIVERSGDEPIDDRRFRFDYPPGRLLIVTAWAQHLIHTVPPGEARPRGMGVSYADELVTPLRRVNIGHELVASLATFLIVRLLLRRAGRGHFASEAPAMLAALLVWFNPALIVNAHGWPQWEAWVLPYTLLAIYFALLDRWLLAGALLATGAMLKGQVLLLLPIFPLWALFSLRIGGLLRLAVGFFAAAALWMSPWLIRDALPAFWVIGGTLAFAWFVASMRARRSRTSVLALAVLIGWIGSPWLDRPLEAAWPLTLGAVTLVAGIVTLALRRPLPLVLGCALLAGILAAMVPAALASVLSSDAPAWLSTAMPRWTFARAMPLDPMLQKAALGAACAIAAAVLVARRGSILVAGTAMFAVLVFLAAAGAGGSFAWLHVGFQTERYPAMSMGSVCNVPALLRQTWGLEIVAPVPLPGLLETPMPLGDFLRLLTFVGLALCALALVIQLRRRDPNALIVFAAAWTLLYALLPQMHERYLAWGAAVSAMLVARGVGGLLIHAALTALQLAMLLLGMASSNGGAGAMPSLAPWLNVFAGLQPHAGYVTLTLALVLLAWSFRRSVPPTAGLAPRKAPARLPSTSRAAAQAAIDRADTSPASP